MSLTIYNKLQGPSPSPLDVQNQADWPLQGSKAYLNHTNIHT
eukprot:CAMPEP_0115243996 /NCGR_PEP_ID=MMETSP0270-20121206/39760_1 /TAXON_ID=71861 /ORGANISM="Scrippsiella trochoidea, Strain CCMP3099" /LENGTH=41 /DNA_ID= /DNA_START= /DNA_END= /DNA_ORIENTATION=